MSDFFLNVNNGKESPEESLKSQARTVLWSQPEVVEAEGGPPELGSDRYRLLEEIESGGMGLIYRARDLKLARYVAIKVLRVAASAMPEAVGAFANEARIVSHLSHPGIVPFYDFGTTNDGRPYHVMKLIEGCTLQEMLRRGESTPAMLLSVFVEICNTMAYAHSHGVIHLDLKPANIMVGEFGEVYVMDWGLARFEGATPTHPGDWKIAAGNGDLSCCIAGTPEYMSPEQARGQSLDAQADVFAMGAILCEILVGQAPYKSKNVRQAHRQALKASMGKVLEDLEVCDTDRALVQLTKKCLAPSRRERPRNAAEVAKELTSYQETALQRAENDMNRFFELSLDMFCIADFDGYFQRINANFSRVLGYSQQELLARPFLDFVHRDDLTKTIRQMSQMKEGQPVVRFTNRYRAINGQYITLEWTAKAIEDEGVIFAVARDISGS